MNAIPRGDIQPTVRAALPDGGAASQQGHHPAKFQPGGRRCGSAYLGVTFEFVVDYKYGYKIYKNYFIIFVNSKKLVFSVSKIMFFEFVVL